ncbi:hypothetical protein RIF29_17247 [Crotalaria pallida]|uniref:Uncharacterized protein n=1 Tax=Crotalaria pallida TaxID=3830 RepID=A0AAN9IF51_CROPI
MEELECTPGVRSFARGDNSVEEPECTLGVRSFASANSHGGSGTFHIKAVRVQHDPKPLVANKPSSTLDHNAKPYIPQHGLFHKRIQVHFIESEEEELDETYEKLHNMLKLSMVGKRYVVMGASYETEIELVGESFSKMDDVWSLLMEEMLKEFEWEVLIEVMLKRSNNFVLKSLFFSQATVQHKPSRKQVLQMLSKEVHVIEEALTKSRI